MIFKPEDIVCVCKRVTKRTIVESILFFSAETVEDIGNLTKAGVTCGSCHEDVEEILKEFGVN
jgi:NifU-like protein